MSKCDIQIEFDRADRTYRGGEAVSGEVTVRVNQDIRCNGILLQYFWATHGRGNRDNGTKHELLLCESQPLQAGEELRLPFEFTSELWPLTYRGNYINVDHYVHVAVDVPWSIDPKHSEEFILLPGDCPDQFTGDRSEAVELKAESQDKASLGIVAKILIGVVVLVAFFALIGFAAILLPFAAVAGLIYWIRKKAIAGRLGEVEISTPHAIVGPGETWPCELSFTPKKTFRINEISAKLVAEESATAGSGTNSTTHRHTLYEEKEIILPAGQLVAGERFSERLEIPLPDTDAWSLDASDNKVKWTIDVRIDIPRFPDWSHNAEVQMIPAGFLSGTPDGAAGLATDEPVPFDEPVESGAPASATDDQTVSSIFELVSVIGQSDRYGNERSLVASAAGDQVFDLSIIVDRVSTTLGFSGDLDADYLQGRTILGTIAGTEQEVQLFARPGNNDAVDSVARDEVWETRAQVAKWDSLYNRLVMLES